MGTCNVIFWQVLIPTATFGSEVWIMSEKDEELFNSFQIYAGKRVQRFPQRAPNISYSYGLGWLKITSFVRVKQLLFVRSILRVDPENVVRVIFELRLKSFCENIDERRMNRFKSPIFNILNVPVIFGVLGPIQDMVEGRIPIASKKAWSQLIWDRAWKLEDANCLTTNMIHKDNDLLKSTLGDLDISHGGLSVTWTTG